MRELFLKVAEAVQDAAILAENRELYGAENVDLPAIVDHVLAEHQPSADQRAAFIDDKVKSWLEEMGLTNSVNQDQIDTLATFGRFIQAALASQPSGETVALHEAVKRTIKTIERQLELISERADGELLDKRPVVQSLTAHKQRLEKALSATPQPAPSVPDAVIETTAVWLASQFDYPWDHMPEKGREDFREKVRTLAVKLVAASKEDSQ